MSELESYIKTLESKIEVFENQIKVLQSKVAEGLQKRSEQQEIIHKLQMDRQINTLLTEIGDDDDRKLFENAMASLNKVNEKIKTRNKFEYI